MSQSLFVSLLYKLRIYRMGYICWILLNELFLGEIYRRQYCYSNVSTTTIFYPFPNGYDCIVQAFS